MKYSVEIDAILEPASLLVAKVNRTTEEETQLIDMKARIKAAMYPRGATLIERLIEAETQKAIEGMDAQIKVQLAKEGEK